MRGVRTREGRVRHREARGPVTRLKHLMSRRTFVTLVSGFVVCIGVVSAFLLYRESTRIFMVSEVVFTGSTHLAETELRHLSGIRTGEGLLVLSARDVAERLKKSPWIRNVGVRKEFPRTVRVMIDESSPFAILEMKGKSFLVDDRGELLEELKDAIPFLPVISGDPFKNRDNFLEALALARVVKDKKIAAEKSRVEIIADKGPQDISMVIDNVVVKIGRGDYEQKLTRLFELEDEIKRRAITVDYVDLRFANRVVLKPMNGVVK